MDDSFLNRETIVVVGYGWVGQANALALARMGYATAYYDIITPVRHYTDEYGSLYDRIPALESLLARDSDRTHYLICVGDRVSEDGVQDIGVIRHALNGLRGARGTVILRSTVLPSSLAELDFDIYLPEFLHEIYAVEECFAPFYFVMGQRDSVAHVPQFLVEWQSRARKVFVGTPEEASYVKYLSNIWNAVRIAFVNEFGDAIDAPLDEDRKKRIERILDFVLERKSYLRYGRGFGGHCLPKDMRAFIRLAESRGAVPLIRGAYESNARHDAREETQRILAQWFSGWEYSRFGLPRQALSRWWRRWNNLPVVAALRSRVQPLVFWAEARWPRAKDAKKTWDAFAQERPHYYANPDTVSGMHADEFETQKSGAADYERFIASDQLLRQHLGSFADKRAVDLGAGIGRLTERLAADWKSVVAVDISREMLSSAKKRLGAKENVEYKETSGAEIPVSSGSVDFIFSHAMFPHIPDRAVVASYLAEIARTLSPGGIAKIQLRTGARVHRWHWFYGVSFRPDELRGMAREAGLEILRTDVPDRKHIWLWLQKTRV